MEVRTMKKGVNRQLENDFLAMVRLMKLPEPVAQFRFMEGRKYQFDFCYPEPMIAIEIEGGTFVGGRHVRGAGYEADCRKYNFAGLKGYMVLRFTASMVHSWEAIHVLKEALGVH